MLQELVGIKARQPAGGDLSRSCFLPLPPQWRIHSRNTEAQLPTFLLWDPPPAHTDVTRTDSNGRRFPLCIHGSMLTTSAQSLPTQHNGSLPRSLMHQNSRSWRQLSPLFSTDTPCVLQGELLQPPAPAQMFSSNIATGSQTPPATDSYSYLLC